MGVKNTKGKSAMQTGFSFSCKFKYFPIFLTSLRYFDAILFYAIDLLNSPDILFCGICTGRNGTMAFTCPQPNGN